MKVRENMYCLRLFGIFGKYEDYKFKFILNTIVINLTKYFSLILPDMDHEIIRKDPFSAYCKINPDTNRGNDR